MMIRRLMTAVLIAAMPAFASAQVANIPSVYLSGSAPTGFSSQAFKMDCNNATPTSGQCWPLMEIYDASGNQATVNSGDHGLTVHVANTNTNITPGDAVSTTTYGAASPVIGDIFVWNGTTYDRLKEGSVAGSLLATLSGTLPAFAATPTFNVAQTTPGTTNAVTPVAAALGGATQTGNIVANNTTAVVIKASAGTLYSVSVSGLGSAPAYLKMYNATSATCGSGTPVARYMIPAAGTPANGAGNNPDLGPVGVAYGTGITYCVTTGIADTDATAPAASTFLVNLVWK